MSLQAANLPAGIAAPAAGANAKGEGPPPRKNSAPTNAAVNTDGAVAAKPRRAIPSWAVSLGIHTLIMLVLALRMQSLVELTFDAGPPANVVVMRDAAPESKYFSAQVTDQQPRLHGFGGKSSPGLPGLSSGQTDDGGSGGQGGSFPTAENSGIGVKVDLDSVLPGAGDSQGIGIGDGPTGIGNGQGVGIARGTGGNGGDDAEVNIFGAGGRGKKFVFVFDRSDSMNDLGGRPLKAAKAQLVKALDPLASVHQFSIIFYNNRLAIFNPNHPLPARMSFGDDQTKSLAKRFIEGIQADGGTEHLPALEHALAQSPDVIFFLTDAADPMLTKFELDRIARLNKSAAVINAIEFGTGAKTARGYNFLQEISRQNRGTYTYVNVNELPAQ